MPPRNPLREEDSLPREQVRGDNITNTRTQRIVRMVDQNGNPQEILMDINDSSPDENGNWIDSTVVNLHMDSAGNPMPEDPRSVVLSHSGLYISSPEQLSHCTSWLHGNGCRNILLGQDGRALAAGRAICTRCDSILSTLYVVMFVCIISIILGIYSGAGWF